MSGRARHLCVVHPQCEEQLESSSIGEFSFDEVLRGSQDA